jgi:hypothetical protein
MRRCGTWAKHAGVPLRRVRAVEGAGRLFSTPSRPHDGHRGTASSPLPSDEAAVSHGARRQNGWPHPSTARPGCEGEAGGGGATCWLLAGLPGPAAHGEAALAEVLRLAREPILLPAYCALPTPLASNDGGGLPPTGARPCETTYLRLVRSLASCKNAGPHSGEPAITYRNVVTTACFQAHTQGQPPRLARHQVDPGSQPWARHVLLVLPRPADRSGVGPSRPCTAPRAPVGAPVAIAVRLPGPRPPGAGS